MKLRNILDSFLTRVQIGYKNKSYVFMDLLQMSADHYSCFIIDLNINKSEHL